MADRVAHQFRLAVGFAVNEAEIAITAEAIGATMLPMFLLPCPDCGAMSVEQIGRDREDHAVRVMCCAACASIYDELDVPDDPSVPPDSSRLLDGRDDEPGA